MQRRRSEAEGLELLDLIRPHCDSVHGISLGGPETNNPPAKFARVYARARDEGYRLTAHAGEEAPATYIADDINKCKVERIDHGYTAFQGPLLVTRRVDEGIPLTMCPLSNQRLRISDDLSTYPLAHHLQAGVSVSVNSDDPSYFSGYVNENFEALVTHLGIGKAELLQLARNSFTGSFASSSQIGVGRAAVGKFEQFWNN
ncbi:adenosine deaminase [Rhodococcus sp. OAS809]|uniref:adenosine deaminase family protein n=1 Tax=Rhodococcus sp. OAS809 TaxID=2663874 RepID=UPI0019E19DFF